MDEFNSTLDFVTEDGRPVYGDVTVYALSTCGFCKRALAFLRENGIRFRYVYVDSIEFEVKKKLKQALNDTYGKSVGFPYLVIDGREAHVGFSEKDWKEIFKLL